MEQKPITFPYKTVGKTPLLLDVHAPEQHGDNASSEGAHVVPALVYFHGGGLTVGNRKSWFPHWLKGASTHVKQRLVMTADQQRRCSSCHVSRDRVYLCRLSSPASFNGS